MSTSTVCNFSPFDAQIYYETYYSALDCPNLPSGYLTFLLDCLSDIYTSGKLTGSSVLDFGTGPTIHNVISASRHFSDIYLSDFSETNRNALWRWLTNDPTANDFSHFFDYVREKENLESTTGELEDNMRNKVRGILACDMTLDNPLFPSILPQFDVVNTCLCFANEPTKTLSGYANVVTNVSSLLKPGGWVVYIDELDCEFYTVGADRYHCTPLNKENVSDVWTAAGFTIDFWAQHNKSKAEKETLRGDNCSGVFCMAARKALVNTPSC